MKYFVAVVLVYSFCLEAIGQEGTPVGSNLEEYKPVFVPIKKSETVPGKEVVIKLNARNQKKSDIEYSFSWSLGGEINRLMNEFRWTPGEDHIGIHPIIFTATDKLTQQSVNQPAIIVVNEKRFAPTLRFNSTFNLKSNFIEIDEGEEFALIVRANDKNKQDDIMLDYYVDNDLEEKLPNAIFEVNDKVATFLWKPNNDQAQKRNFYLTFLAEDNSGLRSKKTYNILVNDITHPPVLKINTKEYYIDEGKALSFFVKAQDEDEEEITYDLITSDIKRGDYFFDSKTGKFQWKPGFDYAQKQSDYTLIFTATDGQDLDSDTIMIRVDPKNYPPTIEPIQEKQVRENQELVIKLDVADKNGDENLIVTAEADFDGFEMDTATKEFRWTPPFSFVQEMDKRVVHVKFKVSDGRYEDKKTVKITVYNREDPAKMLGSYNQTMNLAQGIYDELDSLDRKLDIVVKRKKFWNTFFDISTITIGAFTTIAGSSLASDDLRNTAVPIGSAATTLIGIHSVLDKSKDKLSDVKWKIVGLKGRVSRATNLITRKYGDSPGQEVSDTARFRKDLQDFIKTTDECDIERNRLLTEYTKLSSR
ncbi:hypothetical protein QQ008_00845 [Fulvivirgaceae bacterium BMA10]|uniref:Cadherin domain-containing protein n=1 Tax=Splendidivirga corallicola TaxID=3051826 RepID=A0ABT8KGP1_9BACT|nr:hypothetical protein [Fulvivirgaceae bacterium BMA10]